MSKISTESGLALDPIRNSRKPRLRPEQKHLAEGRNRTRNSEENITAWLATLPEVDPNPIVVVNPAEEEIFYLNPAAERMFPDLAQEVWRHPLLAGVRELAEDLISRKTEAVHCEISAGEYLLQQTIVYLHGEKRLHIHGTDISGRKRAEEEIHHAKVELERRVAQRTTALELANKELEAFCYSVSHDLRAPLRGIGGFARILAENYGAALDGTAQGYLERVLAATDRMGDLIDDLLKLSRITRDTLTPQAVDLSKMAHSIAAALGQTAPERAVEFRIAPDLQAEGDSRLLRALLENLLGNAWKFTSRKEKALIEFDRIAGDNGGSVFRIADNGAGFDMKYAGKLFGPFQRLHGQGEFPGNGIGLATVQRIVHRHGGDIRADAAPDRGAVFYFTLSADATLP